MNPHALHYGQSRMMPRKRLLALLVVTLALQSTTAIVYQPARVINGLLPPMAPLAKDLVSERENGSPQPVAGG